MKCVKPRSAGRPTKRGEEAGARYNIYLAPSCMEFLKLLGDGSLSAGIDTAAARVATQPFPIVSVSGKRVSAATLRKLLRER